MGDEQGDRPDGHPIQPLDQLTPRCLPDGWLPVSAVVVVEALAPETGAVALWQFADDDLSPWKASGMLRSVLNDVEDTMRVPRPVE